MISNGDCNEYIFILNLKFNNDFEGTTIGSSEFHNVGLVSPKVANDVNDWVNGISKDTVFCVEYAWIYLFHEFEK